LKGWGVKLVIDVEVTTQDFTYKCLTLRRKKMNARCVILVGLTIGLLASCGNGGSDDCDSHHRSACYQGDVYWYDSCGEREEKKEDCEDAGCNDGQCGGSCTSHASSNCDGGDVYWYDSCGKKEEKKEDCQGAGCNNGQCGGPVKIEDVCEEMKAALCSYIKRCDLEWYSQLETHETCAQIECDDMGFNDMEFDEIAKSVEAGRVTYDADLAGKCLWLIRTVECTGFENMPDECQNIISGMVAQDGECYQEAECAEGLYCDETVSKCPGQCQPYKGLGDECNYGDCDPDVASCDWRQDVCVELAGTGDVCDYVDCAAGLVCDYNSDPAVCLEPAPEGSDCTFSGGCQGGLRCLNGKCANPASAGQACDIGEDFGKDFGEELMFVCVPHHYCDADIIHGQRTGTCQPKKASGSECLLFYECNSGLLCNGMQINEQIIPGSCGNPIEAGASCNADFEFPECDWDLYCDEQTAVCTTLPGIGDPCVYEDEPECLGDDLYCDSLEYGVLGICQQKKPNGSNCMDYEECQSDNCDIDGTGTCLPDEHCIAP
jgi:hypothetical protein